MREIRRYNVSGVRVEDGASSWSYLQWDCDCGDVVTRTHGQADVQCPSCGQWYNAYAQRLRPDWMDNPSYHDSNIGDMEGFEIQQLRKEIYGHDE